jgi:hypothetical protein
MQHSDTSRDPRVSARGKQRKPRVREWRCKGRVCGRNTSYLHCPSQARDTSAVREL